jgi:benzoyl-CoA reductase/2-hydroxyglutaryl-CoA dehydratase subunit BcrC/BadD/HgdB
MSTLEDYISEFAKIPSEYLSEIRNQKAEGKKIICYYGSRVPVEIIYASGGFPYALYDGGDAGPPEAGIKYLLAFINVQSRYQVGQHDLGLNPVTPNADLIVVDCKEADSERVASAFEFMGLPVWKLGVPQDWGKEIALNYYTRQLESLKHKLEDVTGQTITEDRLKQSTIKYNRIREFLSLIGEARKEDTFPISAEKFIKLNHNILRVKPGTAISYLEKITTILKKERVEASGDRTRIMLVGRALAFGDYALVQMLDELGAACVAEHFDEAMLHKGSVSVEGNQIDNIAKFYLREMLPPCFFTPSWKVRWNKIKNLVDEYRVDGLLYYLLSFDVIYDLENSVFSKKASEAGIPYLTLESSYNFSREATESLKNRIESFVKICRSRG